MFRRLLLGFFALLMAWTAFAQSTTYTFSHLAGPQSGPGSTDGAGLAAQFQYPQGLAFDAAGNLFIADRKNATIRKMTPAGVVTTVAGQPNQTGYVDANGAAARFNGPAGLVVDHAGNLFIVDSRRIRKMTPAGDVTTLAGSGGYDVIDGTGTAAAFKSPTTIAIDSAENLYVADSKTIRRITQSGVVTTIAGAKDQSGTTDANGTSARFSFYSPGLVFDGASNLYIADQSNHTIRKMTPAGDVTTMAGSAAVYGDTDGTGAAARFGYPTAMTIDAAGNLYVCDVWGSSVRKITKEGVVTTIAGGYWGYEDGIGTAAHFDYLYDGGAATDGAGNVYVTDRHCVRKITAAGEVTTVAGQPLMRGFVDTSGSSARFDQPLGAAVDAAGNLYVTDSYNNAIRKIDSAGLTSTLAGDGTSGSSDGTGVAAQFSRPSGIAIDPAGNLYVVDSVNATVRKVTPSGEVTTIAGSPGVTGSDDGSGTAARFNFTTLSWTAYAFLSGIAVDAGGNVFVADSGNHTIRKITSTGAVTTFAGQAGSCGTTDGTGTAARFCYPSGLTLDAAGNLYVADSQYGTVRKVTPAGEVTKFAGGFSLEADGWKRSLGTLSGIALAPDGSLFITASYAIKRLTMTGLVATVGGSGMLGTTDGTGPNALFVAPLGIAVDPAGVLFIADAGSHSIRKGVPATCTPPTVAITAPSRMCGNTLGTASVTNAGAGAVYAWSVTGGSAIGNADGPSLRFSGSSGATSVVLTAFVRDANYCGTSATTTIAIDPAPDASITLSSNAVCPGTSVTASVPDAGSGATYSWSITPPTAFTGGGTSSIAFTVSEAVTVQVTVTNANCSARDATAVDVTTSAALAQRTFSAAGGSGNVAITTTCPWTATSSASWVAITSGASGNGNGSVAFTVAANPTSASRHAALTAAGVRLQITQAGAAVQDHLSYTVRHLAGNLGGPGYADATTGDARFNEPLGIAIDASGNAFVADWGNHVIRKITPAGVVSTFAGMPGLRGATDGTGSAARFNRPVGVAVDSSGTLYVADSYNATIRKITPAGTVSTLAGSPGITGTQDGTGSGARFKRPQAIAVDASGKIFVADTTAHTIRQVTADGTVTTIAGSANSAAELDGTGGAARFASPVALTVDPSGSIYVCDSSGSTVRKIASGGVVTTFAGTAYAFGSVDGTGAAARFKNPAGITIDSSGNLYVVDGGAQKILKITPAAAVTAIAGGTSGSADGTGAAAQFNFGSMNGLAVDSSGNLLVVDATNHTLRKVTPAGVVTTFAGTAATTGKTDGVGSAASFNLPRSVAFDTSGNTFVADRWNYVIRKVTRTGAVTTIAGTGTPGFKDGAAASAQFQSLGGIAIDPSGAIYVADGNAIRKIAGGAVTTVAGSADAQGSVDGPGTEARFAWPYGLACDSSGTLFIADNGNSTIRKMTTNGVVSTVAGRAGVYGHDDGAAATFDLPWHVAVDRTGRLFVTEDSNCLRAIATDGTVTTVAGMPGHDSTVDGVGSAASFSGLFGVAVDPSGNVLVSDGTLIRRVAPDGTVTTVLGLADADGNVDGTGSAARLSGFTALAVDSTGRLVIADSENDAVRIATQYPVGDANGDGLLTAADVFYLINNLFANGATTLGTGDVNGDGTVTVADIFYLISHLFVGGPAPLQVSPGVSALSHDTESSAAVLAFGAARRSSATRVIVPVVLRGTPEIDGLSFRIHCGGSIRNATVRRGGALDAIEPALEVRPQTNESVSYVVSLGRAIRLASGSVIAELELETTGDQPLVLTFDREMTAISRGGITRTVGGGSLTVEDASFEMRPEMHRRR